MGINRKFYRDSTRSYMVIECPGEEKGAGYQYRMLAANEIDGLLSSCLRYIDGNCYLYYEITSRQDLRTLYEDRKIGITELKKILRAAASICGSLERYLLDVSKVIFAPEYLYFDFENDRYLFTYYPEETEEGGLRTLAAFLLEHAEMDDPDDYMAVFKLETMCAGGDFVLREGTIEELFEFDRYIPSAENGKGKDAPMRDEGLPWEAQGLPEPADEWEKREEENSGEKSEIGRATGEEKNVGIGRCFVFSAAGFVAALGVEWKRLLSPPSAEVDKYYVGAMATALIVSVISAAIGVVISVINSKKNKLEELDEMHVGETIFSPAAEYDWYQETSSALGTELVEEAVPMEENSMGKLYGEGDARGYQINLRDLPCSVGRMPELADLVIDDQTISRLHVRFSQEPAGICVTDLNSLNGTYLNGQRLSPNQTEVICPGDEVCIGRLEFIYR